MDTTFERDLDDSIKKWPDEAGYFSWEDVYKQHWGNNMTARILNRFIDDKLLKPNASVATYSLTSEGYEVKRNNDEKGYVARKIKNKEKEDREMELFQLSKQ